MKKWLVHASSMSYYTLEVAAETEEKALEIASDADGGAWKELDDRGDWEIGEKAEEIPERRINDPHEPREYNDAEGVVTMRDLA
jgi:hypothetical protein